MLGTPRLALALASLGLVGTCHCAPDPGLALTTTPGSTPLPAPELGATADRVSFPSLDADLTGAAPTRLDGYLFRPAGPGPFPAVIGLHGCNGLFGRDGNLTPRDQEWALRLRDLGFVVLLPDSFTPRGVTESCTSTEKTIRPGYERARDAYGALVYAEALPYVSADRVALIGWSHGGITALQTVAAVSPARPADLKHDFRVAVAFYPACARVLDRTDWAPTVAPLTILIGASDDWTPAAPCVALGEREKAAGHAVDVVVYPGAFHDFDAPGMPLFTKHGVASTASHTATVGTNPEARADAIARVGAILARYLR